jgi:molybdopterin-biosynthesis enzyme MoeA-like protein
MPRNAAALIIGNEILTGKTQEKNLSFLGQELFALGIELRRAIICPDEIDVIVNDLNELRKSHDWVFTSGGVGPTHDDVTVVAIAKAFGRKLVRSQELEQIMRKYYKSHLTESHLRMADIPEGSRLLSDQDMRFPIVAIENVFIFPGIPELFQMKFPVLRELLRQATPLKTSAIYVRTDEGEIATLMSRIALQHSNVLIGSYPQWNNPDYRVKITIDGRDTEVIKKALQALLKELPSEAVVKVEE